jgi:hypothetical protein
VNLPDRARQLYDWGVGAVFSDCPDRVAGGLDTPHNLILSRKINEI